MHFSSKSDKSQIFIFSLSSSKIQTPLGRTGLKIFSQLYISAFLIFSSQSMVFSFFFISLCKQICVAYDWRKINGGVNCTETKKKNEFNRQNSFRACLCLVITMWQKRLSVLSENSLSGKRQADACDAQFDYVLKCVYR